MNVLFDYNFDPANGLNLIQSFSEIEYIQTGEYNYNDGRLIVPIQTEASEWKVLVYDYNTTIERTTFIQIIDVPDECSSSIIKASATTDYIAILNNDTHKCHIFIRGRLKPWEFSYSIDADYTASTTTEDAGRVKIAGDYLLLSDWTLSPLGTYVGVVNLYKFNTSTEVFDSFATMTLADSVRYGYAIDMRNLGDYLVILIGDPLIDDTLSGFTECGVLDYIIFEDVAIIGAATIYGDATGDNLGNSVDCYLYDGDCKTLVIAGAEGYNTNSGRAYTYTATIATSPILAFLDYAEPSAVSVDRYFGNMVKINDEEHIFILENGINQATQMSYAGGWNIDATMTAYDVIETFGVYYLYRNLYDGDYLVYAAITGMVAPAIFFLDKTIRIKNVVDGSYYTSNIRNTEIKLTLGFSIVGRFRMVMEMENNTKEIDTHNDTIYFIEATESGGSYIYTYQSINITHGDYTEAGLATEVAYKMNALHYPDTYYIVSYNAGTSKYTAYLTETAILTGMLFSFGSNSSTAYLNSAQDTIMGFYNNDQTIFTQAITADRIAILQVPQTLGINIIEAIPIQPTRNANPANEVHIVANINGAVYEILETDEQDIKFNERTTTLTFSFKSTYNGAPIGVNTNQISGRLIPI